ncbi:helix-turn-helix domain-containing protein [Rhodobacterales bacterium FZCC0083]|nr:helix-turn-helix domain-containing protein [Rhodobacterales bacterium FZCC0083]
MAQTLISSTLSGKAVYSDSAIRESPRCMQKHIVDTIGKDQGQVSRAIDRLIEVGLVIKKEGRLMAQ